MYELLPHPSDIGFRVESPDLPAALSEAVAALAVVMTGGPRLEPLEDRPVEIEADSVEELVVALLDECLYRVDAHEWLPCAARLELDGSSARGQLLGLPLVPEDHPNAVHVKAITWHGLQVEPGPPARLTVFVDI